MQPGAARAVRTTGLSATAYAGMFSFGIVMAILGAILPVLSRRIGFDTGAAGNLFLAMNGAMLVTTFALGPLLDRFGLKFAMVGAPALVAAALALIARAADYSTVVAAVTLLGCGGGALNQTTNTLVADLHEDPGRKRAALNLLGVFFGFGALFIPFAMGSLLSALGLETILYLALALTMITPVMSVVFAFPPPRQTTAYSGIVSLARQPLVLALAFLLFFQSGNEFLLGGYISSYLTTTLGASVPAASYVLAAYWGALMVARVVLSRVSVRLSPEALVECSGAMVAVSVGLVLLSPSVVVAGVAAALLGLSIAAIFPTVLGIAGAAYPNASGTVFGILIGVALSGGMTMPWAAGHIARTRGVGAGLAVAISNALCIVVLQWVAGRIASRRGHAA